MIYWLYIEEALSQVLWRAKRCLWYSPHSPETCNRVRKCRRSNFSIQNQYKVNYCLNGRISYFKSYKKEKISFSFNDLKKGGFTKDCLIWALKNDLELKRMTLIRGTGLSKGKWAWKKPPTLWDIMETTRTTYTYRGVTWSESS